jgi:hypothetical protein
VTGVVGTGAGKVYAGEAEESLGAPDALKGFRGMLIEPFHLEPNHDRLTVVEELRKKAN